MEQLECPKDENRCKACVFLAQQALANALPKDLFEVEKAVIAANSNVRAVVEDDVSMLGVLGCEQRQLRAIDIGKDVGTKMSERF